MDPDVLEELVSQVDYRALIGSLLYLTTSRPDITFTVGICARFQADPKKSHLEAARRILKYLKAMVNFGIWYPDDDNLELIGYSDSDFGGYRIDRKSILGTC
ncbi:hypothetical protein ACS0TY_029055 [Phlomoides rotata]